jgi:D-sedoheptulose 7-phosphate isomerase
MKDYKQYISNETDISISIKKQFIERNLDRIITTSRLIHDCQYAGNKVLYFGNGGSAADSQHLAAEHVNKLKIKRKALGAIALTTDTSVLTSIANDMDFDSVFSRQIEALARPGDICIGISTSGNSPNIIKALKAASEIGIRTIAFTGNDGGIILKENLAEIIFNVEGSNVSSRIQETHILLGHLLIEVMDELSA